MPETAGLSCLTCGDPCVDPQGHLANERVDTSLIPLDAPILRYAERNKWGRRWRVIEAFVGGQVRPYVDDMGPEDEYLIGPFDIPSAGDETSEWNRFGECMDIALWNHDRNRGGFQRKRVPAATAQAWAEEVERNNESYARWRHASSTFGVGGFLQRAR